MKTFISAFVLTFSMFLFSCSEDETMHSVRFDNQSTNDFYILVDSVDFDTVRANTVTEYLEVGDEGKHTIGGDLTGTVTLAGTGDHKWTITINKFHSFSLTED